MLEELLGTSLPEKGDLARLPADAGGLVFLLCFCFSRRPERFIVEIADLDHGPRPSPLSYDGQPGATLTRRVLDLGPGPGHVSRTKKSAGTCHRAPHVAPGKGSQTTSRFRVRPVQVSTFCGTIFQNLLDGPESRAELVTAVQTSSWSFGRSPQPSLKPSSRARHSAVTQGASLGGHSDDVTRRAVTDWRTDLEMTTKASAPQHGLATSPHRRGIATAGPLGSQTLRFRTRKRNGDE